MCLEKKMKVLKVEELPKKMKVWKVEELPLHVPILIKM